MTYAAKIAEFALGHIDTLRSGGVDGILHRDATPRCPLESTNAHGKAKESENARAFSITRKVLTRVMAAALHLALATGFNRDA